MFAAYVCVHLCLARSALISDICYSLDCTQLELGVFNHNWSQVKVPYKVSIVFCEKSKTKLTANFLKKKNQNAQKFMLSFFFLNHCVCFNFYNQQVCLTIAIFYSAYVCVCVCSTCVCMWELVGNQSLTLAGTEKNKNALKKQLKKMYTFFLLLLELRRLVPLRLIKSDYVI